jgi:hypothetical protein
MGYSISGRIRHGGFDGKNVEAQGGGKAEGDQVLAGVALTSGLVRQYPIGHEIVVRTPICFALIAEIYAAVASARAAGPFGLSQGESASRDVKLVGCHHPSG